MKSSGCVARDRPGPDPGWIRFACETRPHLELTESGAAPFLARSRRLGADRSDASAANSSRATSCASAHTAAPRTSGLSHRSNRSASSAKRSIAGVADRDQHVAHKAVAADALDRRFREQRAKRGVVEPSQFGKRRRAQFSRARRVLLRARPARTCSTGRPRGNRRSHRCGCRWLCEIRAGSVPCSRW